MRLQTLELIRYGKFSDQTLHFPKTDCDFHLIVGANEAGKSTLRRAVSELLFGMPLRSDMGFIHPLAELRLGAVIESAAGTLAFHRARGRKSLRRPDDEVLPDAALAEHLGTTSETLFKRMFCLDLNELLEGGQSILDASDDVGQLLFQSAAGLTSLGAVSDALAEEASKLFAPRRSGERAFYQALDRHEAAKQELRGLTVNVRQWTTARTQVEALQASQQEALEQYRSLSNTRQQWERIRRIAPRAAQLREVQSQLQALADTAVFPEDAARRLVNAETAMATQSTTRDLHRKAITSLQTELDALMPDEAILAQASAVEALAAQGHACMQHPQKIERAEQAVQALLRDVATRAVQLGWPVDEKALRARIPVSLALKTLGALLEERGALLQAQQSAQDNHDRAKAALVARLKELETAPSLPSPSPALGAVLQEAQGFKFSMTRLRALQAAQTQAEAQLETACAALSIWRMDAPALAVLALPTEEQLTALKGERAALVATLEAARQQSMQAQEKARQSALALAQFTASHSVVTLDEVQQARKQRDRLWQRVKQEQEPLASGAPQLDYAIEEADRLVDSQRDHASDSAKLLSLRQEGERDADAAQAREKQHTSAQQAQEDFETRWARQVLAMGLPGMPLLDLSGWLAQRKAALDAASVWQAKLAELAAEQAAEAAATVNLRAALPTSGAVSVERGLGELCACAEKLIYEHQAARAGAESLTRQLAEARTEFDYHERTLSSRNVAVAQWQERWDSAVKVAALDRDWITLDAARGAIDLADQVLNLLAQVDDLRLHRIQNMQQDLADFDAAAQALERSIGKPDGESDTFTWVQVLVQRLQHAREIYQARIRLSDERHVSDTQARSTEAALAMTRASLSSLYKLAQSEDYAHLRACIADSDRRRELDSEQLRHRKSIVVEGDGMSLDSLLAECDAVSPETLKPQLEALDTQLSGVVEQQTRLATELAQAQAELNKVQGGTDAAVAESKRLESLAQLGETAERYITVATGHRLLRWAIDRYRERKQGPLLLRASALFSRLTLGGFDRLAPDFEVTPPRLIAVRTAGERVGIEGLSEGTRDQLFLALRLAALEMQIDGDRPLPFIADDLFVNFHDSRSRAGLTALGELACKTQVVFLTHHQHLVEVAQECIGSEINVVYLGAPDQAVASGS